MFETFEKDFTMEHFRDLLKLAKKHYVFRLFNDYDPSERFLLLRHDIDMSPHSAVRMAEIEASEGIVATYFLYLHSYFYNLLELDVIRCIKRILDLGHRIGLHFDANYYKVCATIEIAKLLFFEADVLCKTFGEKVDVFSLHNPTPVNLASFTQPLYGGLINTYSEWFRNSVSYVSDSNGYWPYRRLSDVLTEARDDKLQVLLHPEWWQEQPMPPRTRVQRCIDGRALKSSQLYDNALQRLGRRNIS